MPLYIQSDDYFMEQAIKEARKAYEQGEVPVGAVLVSNGMIIARSHNQTELLNDVTAHAEMIAITSGAEYIGGKYLNQCSLYVTLEPCPMCAAALRWAQLEKLVYGAEDPKNGYMRFGNEMLHPKTKVLFGIKQTECQQMMSDFFQQLRKNIR